jgi:hypothetical protein
MVASNSYIEYFAVFAGLNSLNSGASSTSQSTAYWILDGLHCKSCQLHFGFGGVAFLTL